MKTQVCIIGGGPSGLLLSQLLHLKGIDTIVLERQSREYVLGRIRAGVLEHGFAALMREAQCGERMDREGEIHEGFFISNHGDLKRVDLHKYSGGSSVVVYGQTELTKDLYEARDRMKGAVIHNAEDVQPHDLTSAKPYVTYRSGDEIVRIDCDYVIGADGFGFAQQDREWLKVPQVGAVRIGADVEVGANTTIDRGAIEDTVIEDGVKLDNQIQIGHNVRIGAHSALAACVGVSGSTTIGKRCQIGGAVGIVGHLSICDDVAVTGLSMVSHSINEPGVYSSGLPAIPAAEWRRAVARLHRLDRMAGQVAALGKQLNRTQDD